MSAMSVTDFNFRFPWTVQPLLPHSLRPLFFPPQFPSRSSPSSLSLFLTDILTNPSSPPKILSCLRDHHPNPVIFITILSLLSTHAANSPRTAYLIAAPCLSIEIPPSIGSFAVFSWILSFFLKIPD
ncbi:hypothetical protein P168DRAFT_130193 [Aspergillus campestris IBT 28561]|uniref:Uncharacterized protein n=1 Tax=Aspergillus campestris (strain IBT 28561) TaxID=1392248 RepID=A0A2I1D7B0_ASPC2|nr:uncharacterized protein P168DRAFT_130193 [Aspergillus campestris IBT 28561]PKY05747.1 hypothetical protein P168DRAFT_130193 [Aspergillus campestris IBT 28561]